MGVRYEATSAFWTTPVNIQAFTTNFAFQLSSATADGFTFTIQGAGPTALGGDGGSLGYGPNPNRGTMGGIAKSVAIKFDIYSNTGEGTDSTGMFTNGVLRLPRPSTSPLPGSYCLAAIPYPPNLSITARR